MRTLMTLALVASTVPAQDGGPCEHWRRIAATYDSLRYELRVQEQFVPYERLRWDNINAALAEVAHAASSLRAYDHESTGRLWANLATALALETNVEQWHKAPDGSVRWRGLPSLVGRGVRKVQVIPGEEYEHLVIDRDPQPLLGGEPLPPHVQYILRTPTYDYEYIHLMALVQVQERGRGSSPTSPALLLAPLSMRLAEYVPSSDGDGMSLVDERRNRRAHFAATGLPAYSTVSTAGVTEAPQTAPYRREDGGIVTYYLFAVWPTGVVFPCLVARLHRNPIGSSVREGRWEIVWVTSCERQSAETFPSALRVPRGISVIDMSGGQREVANTAVPERLGEALRARLIVDPEMRISANVQFGTDREESSDENAWLLVGAAVCGVLALAARRAWRGQQ